MDIHKYGYTQGNLVMRYTKQLLIPITFLLCSLFYSTQTLAYSYTDAVILKQEEESIKAFDDRQTMDKNQTLVTGNVTTNDSGVISSMLTSSSSGLYGSLSYFSTGEYTYTIYPDSSAVANLGFNQSLTEIFYYKIIGSNDHHSTAALIITIIGNTANEDVVALDDLNSISLYSIEPVTGNVTSNDTGFNTVSLLSSQESIYGSLFFDSAGNYSYQINSNFDFSSVSTVNDVFTYQINSLGGDSATATLTITIISNTANKDMVALDDLNSISINSIVPVTGNVTSNDTGFNTVSLISSPVSIYGSLIFDSAGNYSYQINGNFDFSSVSAVNDVFTYQIDSLGGESATATLTITIVDVDNSSEFKAWDDYDTFTIGDISITGNVTDNDIGFKAVVLLSAPASEYGVLSFDTDGTYIFSIYSGISLDAGEVVTDIFNYQIQNLNGNTDQAQLFISIINNGLTDFSAVDDVNNITRGFLTTTTVEGDVSTNDTGASNYNLISSVISNYGSLAFNNNGSYIYTLFNRVAEIQELEFNQSLTDIFTYQIVHETGATTQAVLKITIFGTAGSITDNVEIEPNNRSNLATPLNSANNMRGHLSDSVEKDWFSIQSTGNEIIHIDLCPSDSSCFDKKAWVLYVFDAAKLTSLMELETIPFYLVGDDTGQTLSIKDGTLANNHLYLNHNAGTFEGDVTSGDTGSLIGLIDPCYGNTTSLDIGVGDNTKTYYIAISSPLARTDGSKDAAISSCEGGTVLLKESGPKHTYQVVTGEDASGNPTYETKEETTTWDTIFIYPRSDDQYMFTITRTGHDPLIDNGAAGAKFDSGTNKLFVPRMRIVDQLYSLNLDLEQSNKRSTSSNIKLTLSDYNKLNELVSGDPNIATYNPDNNVIRIPKFEIENDATQSIYSLVLLYYPETETSPHWIELIDVHEIK